MKFPKSSARYLNAILLSGVMSFVVSGFATAKAVGGLPPGIVMQWLGAWAIAWPIAAVVAILVGPRVQRLVARLTQ
ncbi:DUF2798 domain-containing protein [Litorivicinus lipolyticus]|uniref:DUF2798 domain-containing protein n=1 Tax=Litorivicinus lipolyticus TaxID=418701 RepID=A0A5Q2QDZ5_9GAMM|nr:DUF2798 domain-containing protein [Litorivicinus lipolyticus]QGG80080.1 DUF2798 domain-containing protein [Litorivicinus lipolyticus]